MTNRAGLFHARRTRDKARVLLIIGTVLLLPPMVSISLLDTKIAGIPLTLIYLFAVWALLIAGTAMLTRALAKDAPSGEHE